MINNALIKPEWLEIIACCCAKVQMDLIRAIVAWQTDGTMPDFRGTKKALFLMMVRDLTGQTAAAEPVTAEASQEAETQQKEESETPATEESPQQQPDHISTPAPATPVRRKKDPRRNFFPYSPLY